MSGNWAWRQAVRGVNPLRFLYLMHLIY
jgi:hypothetical protein